MSDLLKAIILGVVEGVTEFLPISSTGHLLLVQRWLGIDLADDPFWKTFAIFIQIGAIAAVVVYFRDRILHLLRGGDDAGKGPADGAVDVYGATEAHGPTVGFEGGAGSGTATTSPSAQVAGIQIKGNRPLLLVVVGSLPLGFAVLAEKLSESYQESAVAIAAAIGIGGVLMILLERLRPTPRTHALEQMTYGQALLIGVCQVLAAVFPGTSRSAATILGGLTAGLSREAAAEFSFFLAIPAMVAACGYKLVREADTLSLQHGLLLTIGTLVSFLVAWAVIGWFMHWIRRHTFVPFAIYRIVLAAVVLLLAS